MGEAKRRKLLDPNYGKPSGFDLKQQAVQRFWDHYHTAFLSGKNKNNGSVDDLVQQMDESLRLEKEFKSIHFFFDKKNNIVIEPKAFTREFVFGDNDKHRDELLKKSIDLWDLRWSHHELPDTPCVYFAFDLDFNIYCIGFSKKLRNSWNSHRLKKWNDEMSEKGRLNPKTFLVPVIKLAFVFVNEEDGRDWVRLYKQNISICSELPTGRFIEDPQAA